MEQLDLESPKGDPTEGPARCFRGKMTNEVMMMSRPERCQVSYGAPRGNPIMGGGLPTSLGSQPYLLGAKASELKRNGGNRFEVAWGSRQS